MKRETKQDRQNKCLNTLDIQLLPFMELKAGKKRTFYCKHYNAMTSIEDCEKCKFYQK